jgi:4-hydroxy-tetrahydrodipicolinate reductase
MGRLIIKQISGQLDMKLVAAIDAPSIADEGKDAGEIAGVCKLGIEILGADKLAEALNSSKPDVLIDFTTPSAAVQNVKAAAKAGVAVVVGTTGLSKQQMAEIEETVKKGKIRAVVSPNFSVGVNVFFKSAKETAKLLGKDYGAEIVEVHHVHKKDAPSGTALKVAHAIAGELGLSEAEIKIKSIREGEVVGTHTVTFSSPYEEIEITHRAKNREVFAAGAVKAARYVATKGKPGVIQDMQDVLGLR